MTEMWKGYEKLVWDVECEGDGVDKYQVDEWGACDQKSRDMWELLVNM